MGTYEAALAEWGRHADASIASITGERDAALADVASTRAALVDANATIAQLRAELEECRNPTPQPVTLFSAKPEPNTEAEYAASEARAGMKYPLHRHYATSWTEFAAKVNGCKGEVCAQTISLQASINTAVINALPDRPLWLGYHHEPEDDIDAGRFTLAQFRAGQAAFRAAVDAANANRTHKIRFGLCLMGPYTWRTRNVDDYFVDGVHDHIGTDPYAGFITNTSSGTEAQKQAQFSVTPDQMFGRQLAFARDKGVDIVVPEWGLSVSDPANEPGKRAAWIRACNEYARVNGFAWLSYWDHGGCWLRTDDEFRAAGGA